MSRIPSSEREAFRTLDGSLVTEIVHPDRDSAMRQSLALAEVAPGMSTRRHRHHRTEEIYFVSEGAGEMHLGDEVFSLGAGDSVVIRPATPHYIRNTGQTPLKFFCCCAPAYSDADTELLDD